MHKNSVNFYAGIEQTLAFETGLLGAICFGDDFDSANSAVIAEMPCIRVSMPVLAETDSACEVWLSTGAAIQGRLGDVCFRHDGQMLFGAIELPQFPESADTLSLQQATESAYRQIFALLDELRYPHAYRFWNYMPDINGSIGELERYHLFNIGRQEAFLASGRTVSGPLPAACALGTQQETLSIAFVAGKLAPIALENPRQICAHEYPEQYGPRSPTFSRASLLRHKNEDTLLVSGTASIIGHETLHVGDVLAQTRETLINLEAIAMEANCLIEKPKFNLMNMRYRVYVRNAKDLSIIRDEMQRAIGDKLQACYVQADICRKDLLLEIEAFASASNLPSNPAPRKSGQ